MALIPLDAPKPLPIPKDRLTETDGFAYYTALAAPLPRHLRKLTALEQMYGYYIAD